MNAKKEIERLLKINTFPKVEERVYLLGFRDEGPNKEYRVNSMKPSIDACAACAKRPAVQYEMKGGHTFLRCIKHIKTVR